LLKCSEIVHCSLLDSIPFYYGFYRLSEAWVASKMLAICKKLLYSFSLLPCLSYSYKHAISRAS